MKRCAVFGVPRSGTSWIGEILNSSPHTVYKFQPLFSYALKDAITPASSRAEIDAFFERLLTTEDGFLDRSEARATGALPSFPKREATHIVFKEVRYLNVLSNLLETTEDVRLCCVVRNPLAVLNSWLNAPREFRRDLGWSAMEEWRRAPKKNLDRPEEFFGFERWKEATRSFVELRSRFPARVHLLRYRDLVARPVESTELLFGAFELEVTGSTVEFLRASRSERDADPYSVYRSRSDDQAWREQLDARIVESVWDELADSDLSEYLE